MVGRGLEPKELVVWQRVGVGLELEWVVGWWWGLRLRVDIVRQCEVGQPPVGGFCWVG